MLDVKDVHSWLAEEAGECSELMVQAHLFGSVLSSDGASDADMLIVFNKWDVRSECTALKLAFSRKYELPLHIQMFHRSQIDEIEGFLDRAKESRRVL